MADIRKLEDDVQKELKEARYLKLTSMLSEYDKY